ncbi:50S ribosomal protein L9 [Candidatus Tremblaya princeps]|uniref:Large ribosomal subunit protein bL9 n=1 Tax=Tremblaya princeps TaxID=189385 RepID=A0A143WP46_TREPR|nr:50S ribosomal protein L9 [Candidatus Tremblaya princeps]
MKVILLCDIGRLGSAGDVVTVRRGHAMNMLLPSGAAVACGRARSGAPARREAAPISIAPRYLFLRREAEVSIRPRDVVSLLRAFGVCVWIDQVDIVPPTRGYGEHTALIRSPRGVTHSVRVRVTRTGEG